MNRAYALSFLTLLVPFAACDGEETVDGQELTIESFAEIYQDARCDYVVRCGFAPDAKTCHDVIIPDQAVLQGVGWVVFGTLGFDQSAAKSCIDSFSSAPCDEQNFFQTVPEGCLKAFTGRGGKGAPCFVSGFGPEQYRFAECADGFGCAPPMECDSACCVGSCQPKPAGIPIGQECTEGPCVIDGWCDNGMCVARAKANESCSGANSCVPGYACDGKCFKQSDRAEVCNPNLSVNPCKNYNDICDPDSKKCVALPEAGKACIVNGTFPGGMCARYSSCLEGKCVRLPTAGEDCTGACMAELRCDTEGSMTCGSIPQGAICVPE